MSARNLAMRLAVEAVSSPPTVTSSLISLSVKSLRLKRCSKSSGVGLKRLIFRMLPPLLKISSAVRKSRSCMRGLSVNMAL